MILNDEKRPVLESVRPSTQVVAIHDSVKAAHTIFVIRIRGIIIVEGGDWCPAQPGRQACPVLLPCISQYCPETAETIEG